jgi:hypothetical protein
MTKSIARIDNNTGIKINEILSESLPITMGNVVDFCQSLQVAGAINNLRQAMLSTPEVKKAILSLMNNKMGFLTDRTASVINRNRRERKWPSEPYSFEDLVDPIIEGLLKGYRITGNEINIISGQFYAAKNGNYRQIIEHNDISDFKYNNRPADLLNGGKLARVKCWASWNQNGKKCSIGIEQDDELILQVRVNYGMGEDAVVGKAHAKLFKRVLERITNRAAPESTEVGGVYDAEFTTELKIDHLGEKFETIDKSATLSDVYSTPDQKQSQPRNPLPHNGPPENTDMAGNSKKPKKQSPPQIKNEQVEAKKEFDKFITEFGEGLVMASAKNLAIRVPPINMSMVKKIEREISRLIDEESSAEDTDQGF